MANKALEEAREIIRKQAQEMDLHPKAVEELAGSITADENGNVDFISAIRAMGAMAEMVNNRERIEKHTKEIQERNKK